MAANPIIAKMEVSPELYPEMSRISLRVQRASTIAVREALDYAEMVAKVMTMEGSTNNLWKNDTGNLSRTITGYVAGDPASEVYRYESLVQPPSSGSFTKEFTARTISKSGEQTIKDVTIKNTQSYLDKHYRVNRGASPPVMPKKGTIVGVLHKYMQYAPDVQANNESVLIRALEQEGTWDRLMYNLERELDR